MASNGVRSSQAISITLSISSVSIEKKTKVLQKCLEYVKTLKKENLPTKVCLICKEALTWRKKWQKLLGGSKVLQ